ncbi:Glycine-rich domain-containing protein-like [Parasponia andersonii]|uniref:Glycine-rich domain-containing protein-like n=1 Tax=Parasponia andersonii TaxID=3476 RepID=A0A2P5B1J1_PARAD|nr:Glycine-rich domain-containing protein-like [Parasponia andersonii]
MSSATSGSEILANMSTRSLSAVSEVEAIRLGLDLVSAARRNIGFLRAVAESQWLHDQKPTLLEAIRRYNDLWMPLISDLTVGSTPPLILPPIDVEWVWFCHTLNPVRYREYCKSKFSKFIGKAAIFDEENEEYAVMRCREIWVRRYPNEPFENGVDSDQADPVVANDYEELLTQVTNQRFLYSKFSEPYRSEVVYLIAARQRYKGFLYMMQRSTEVPSRLVPASDILLMWLTHQGYPTEYAEDLKEIDGGDTGKVVSAWETVTKKEVEDTKNLWETTFDQPYEKAGGEIGFNLDGVIPAKPPVYWEVSDTDVNTKYKSMLPRFLLEVCVFVRLKAEMKAMLKHTKRDILRLRMIRCHRELKLDKTVSNFSNESWQKAWHLYCEFGTKGLVIELRRLGGYCFKASTVEETATFHWNDLLRAPSLTLQRQIDQQVKSISSITPPVQAPYLLKCVPDHVTDDSGAMISDVILKMNQYRPQEGRWLSRSVLDHAGRECFVIRIRVGGGFWRRGGETPSAVKWEDRIIEIREGSWSYVAGSIGRAPEKVVGTATPKEPPEQWKSAWQFSTGDELMVRWESSMLISGLSFCLKNQSAESMVKLLKGRKMQYQVKKVKSQGNNSGESRNEQEEEDEEEEDFLTLVRFTEDDPNGRATALLNWKLLVVEFLPEEDAVFVLLLCISILRSVSDMKKEDLGCLLMRRRLKEARLGSRDWGSVVLHPFSSSSFLSPYLQPWYWNAEAVMISDSSDNTTRPPAFSHSPEEGSDQLYKRGIFM